MGDDDKKVYAVPYLQENTHVKHMSCIIKRPVKGFTNKQMHENNVEMVVSVVKV